MTKLSDLHRRSRRRTNAASVAGGVQIAAIAWWTVASWSSAGPATGFPLAWMFVAVVFATAIDFRARRLRKNFWKRLGEERVEVARAAGAESAWREIRDAVIEARVEARRRARVTSKGGAA